MTQKKFQKVPSIYLIVYVAATEMFPAYVHIYKQHLKFLGLAGIAHLFNVYESSPSYTNEEGQMNVADQLAAVSCHNYLM